MSYEDILKELISLGKDGFVTSTDLTKYYSKDSLEYNNLVDDLEKNDISVEDSEELNSLENELNESPDLCFCDIRYDDSLNMYLNEIKKYKLLSKEEEFELGKEIYEGNLALAKLALIEADDNNNIDKSEYDSLLVAAEKGEKAQDKLIYSNLRLVIYIAKKYINSKVPLMDIIQDGNMGLTRAARKFDYTKNVRFSTYAVFHIKQAIRIGISSKSNSIYIPVRVDALLSKMLKCRDELTQELNRTPTVDEIAKRLDIPVNKVIELSNYSKTTESLNKQVGDEDSELEDFIQDKSLNPQEISDEIEKKKLISEGLDLLEERERKILCLYYGLTDGKEYSYADIGKMYNLSRERIRQIINGALRKIRCSSRAKELRSLMKC